MGWANLTDYFSENEIEVVREAIRPLLNDLKELPELAINNGVTMISGPGQVRIRHVDKYLSLLKRFSSDIYLIIFNFIFSGKLQLPSLMYTLNHDGTYKHPTLTGKSTNPYGGTWHLDQWHHQLKCLFLMTDVNETNGGTEIMEKSSAFNLSSYPAYKKQYLASRLGSKYKMYLKSIGIGKNDFYNHDYISALSERKNKIFITGKKGDLILFDTRSYHKAPKIRAGVREILWYYF